MPHAPLRSDEPVSQDPFALAATEVVGGPPGSRVARRRQPYGGRGARAEVLAPVLAPVVSVLAAAAAALVALGVLQKGYCFSHGWGGADVFWHACFSDLPNIFVSTGLATGSSPYGPPAATAQPPGAGAVLWVLSLVVPPGENEQAWFVGLWAVVASLLAIVTAVLTAATARRDPWRGAQFAMSPLLITLPLISVDLVAVALVALGLWWWARERPLAAGVALGVGAACRGYVVVVLLALVLVAVRAGARAAWRQTCGAAILAWLSVLVAVGAASGSLGVLTAYRTWALSGVEYGSVWMLAALAGAEVPAGVASALAVVGALVAVVLAAMFALSTQRRPGVAEVAVVALVGVMVTAKSVPLQASLWLLPLVALVGLPWRRVLPWFAVEVGYFVMVWLYLGGQSDSKRAIPAVVYGVFLVVRLAAWIALAWHTWRRAAARPPADPHLKGAAAAVEDPDDVAGPAAGRPDAVLVAREA